MPSSFSLVSPNWPSEPLCTAFVNNLKVIEKVSRTIHTLTNTVTKFLWQVKKQKSSSANTASENLHHPWWGDGSFFIKNWLSTDDFKVTVSILLLSNIVTMTESWFRAKLCMQTVQSHYGRRICANPQKGHTGGQSPAVFVQNRQSLCWSYWMIFFYAYHKDLNSVTLKEFYDVGVNERSIMDIWQDAVTPHQVHGSILNSGYCVSVVPVCKHFLPTFPNISYCKLPRLSRSCSRFSFSRPALPGSMRPWPGSKLWTMKKHVGHCL